MVFLRLIEREYVTLVLMSFGAFALIGIDYVIGDSIGRYMCLVSELISDQLNIFPTLPATRSYAMAFPSFFRWLPRDQNLVRVNVYFVVNRFIYLCKETLC